MVEKEERRRWKRGGGIEREVTMGKKLQWSGMEEGESEGKR